MTYNTTRDTLILPEYGRYIQDMVQLCIGLEDRSERQRCAETIVKLMASMNPEVRKQPDYQQRLWDQLAIMSDYKLDIDYPVEVVTKEQLHTKPYPMAYGGHSIRYRHYGHLTEQFIRRMRELPEGEEREELTGQLANFMKRSLFYWNPDAMNERKVDADIYNYTEGEIQLSEHFRFAPITGGTNSESLGSMKKKKKK